jgi:hypothetical protein
MAPAQPPPPPAVPEDGPRPYAARISDGGDDDDDDDDNGDDNDFEGDYLPLMALAGVRGGPAGRNENHPGSRGGNAKSRNQRSMYVDWVDRSQWGPASP